MTDTISIDYGSLFLFQERLFTQLNLSDVLESRKKLALKQFSRGTLGDDPGKLIERIYERFATPHLVLSDQIEVQKDWPVSNGTREYQFGIHFSGDPLLWRCSPDPVDDILPERCDFNDWFLDPGETLERPYGEVFRNQLILIGCQKPTDDDLDEFKEILAWQKDIILTSNSALFAQLHMLSGQTTSH